MNAVDAIILGVIQGVTEFIPVSSSGHLLIAQTILGVDFSRNFLEFINIGTFLVLIIYFRHEIVQMWQDVFKNKKYNLARNIAITATPVALAGFILADFIESNSFFNSGYVICFSLFSIGSLMIVLNRLPHRSKLKDGSRLSPARALVIGLAQVIALIPGVSRSGSTIIAGRFMGLAPAAAAQYSFLVAIPLVFGVILRSLLLKSDYLVQNIHLLALSNIFAFIIGLLVVKFMMNYLKTHTLALFGWYRIMLATIFFAYLLLH